MALRRRRAVVKLTSERKREIDSYSREFGSRSASVPELILPAKWKKRRGKGTTAKVDITKRVFVAPQDASPQSAALRVHEYLHIKESDPREEINAASGKNKYVHNAVSALEDMRVDYLAGSKYGLDMDALSRLSEQVLLMIKATWGVPIGAVSGEESRKQLNTAAFRSLLSCIASYHTGSDWRVEEVIGHVIEGYASISGTKDPVALKADIMALIDESRHAGKTTGIVGPAKRLVKMFTPLHDSDGSSDGDGESDSPPTSLEDGGATAVDLMMRTQSAAVEEQMKEEGYPYDSAGKFQPGKAILETPKLTRAPRGFHIRTGRAIRPDAHGMSFRYPDRYATDKAMFGTLKRDPFTTILVDVSGSMSLTMENVLEIVKHANGSTIATYCGSGTQGPLKIIAADGKIAEEEEMAPEHGGNVIDLESLVWLSKQRGPRIWICDGIVTGAQDMSSGKMRRACFTVMRRNQIHRFHSVKSFLEAIKKKHPLSHSEWRKDMEHMRRQGWV